MENEAQFQLIKAFLISVFLVWIVGALFNMDFAWLAQSQGKQIIGMVLIVFMTGIQLAIRGAGYGK